MNDITRVATTAKPPQQRPAAEPPDPRRQAMIDAAQAYDALHRDLNNLQDKLLAAEAQRDAKDSEIAELRRLLEFQRQQFDKQLAEARSDVQVANQTRDQAYTDRSEALAVLSAIQGVLDRVADHGLEPPPRRRRNGKHASGTAAPSVDSGGAGAAGAVSDESGGGS